MDVWCSAWSNYYWSLFKGFNCFCVVSGHSPDGGAFVWDHHPLLSRKLPTIGWWCAWLHPAPVSWAGKRLSGQVPERPGHVHVLCRAAGETGEVASWGEETATWLHVAENGFHGCKISWWATTCERFIRTLMLWKAIDRAGLNVQSGTLLNDRLMATGPQYRSGSGNCPSL